jgi:hypothetical protein
VPVAVVSAIIAAVASLVVAVATAVAQRRLQSAKSEQDAKLEKLKNELSDMSAERTARRSYEYDARKRLYTVTEPILFQLFERAEDLRASIIGIARTARRGGLDLNSNWLSYDGYYLRSTIHRLLAPVALFHLLQDGLTQVDLGLDPNIRTQYSISKYLAWALSDHYEFAKYEPEIPYDPDASGLGPGAGVPPQGLNSGIIDTAGESLILRLSSGPVRVMRFGEFNEAYAAQNSKLYAACAPVAQLLFNFHPRTHPVLWRILIAQAHLCAACITIREHADSGEPSGSPQMPIWDSIPSGRRNDYDWRQRGDKTADIFVFDEPFSVAKQYLKERLHPRH